MGSWYSAQSSDSVFLIGKLSGKTLGERKFFSLAEKYLEQTIKPIKATNEDDKETRKGDFKQCVIGKQCGENVTLQSSNSSLHQNHEVELLFIPKPRTKKLFFFQTYVQWRANINFEFLQKLFFQPQKTIYLLKINQFPDFVNDFRININKTDYSLFDFIQEFLKIMFLGMDVKWLDDIDLEETKWNITERCHILTEQLQYLVTDFFEPLQTIMPKDGYCIMGFTWTDLYPEEKYNFALGEASCRHQSGVFSFGRFPPSTFDPSNPKDITEISIDVLWKLLKVSSHEIGHLFGMEHCEFFHCHMNESLSMAEAMNQPLFFCPVCLRKIHHVCQFDILERYKKLEKFIEDINIQCPSDKWTECIVWLKRCKQFLQTEEI